MLLKKSKRGGDKTPLSWYNEDNKSEESRAMKDKVVMIISICAFAISWGEIVLAAILEVIKNEKAIQVHPLPHLS